MFDAAKRKFRDISFEQLDTDDKRNSALANKYNVKGIPRVVMLDDRGNVLYNGGAPRGPGVFEGLINQHR